VYDADTAQIVAEIKDLLDTRVRPAVAQDGGDILFSRFEPETGVVWLNMRGACSGCPSSAATLKAGVENMLKHYVPEVTRVEQTLYSAALDRPRPRHLPRVLLGRPPRGRARAGPCARGDGARPPGAAGADGARGDGRRR